MEKANMPKPVLEGATIRLRPITETDTENIVRWRNNPNVSQNFIYRAPFTVEGHQRWLKDRVRTGEVIQYIITNKASRRDIGSVYLRDMNPNYRSAEFGIFIGEDDARGHGIGTETTRLFLSYAFEQLGLHRVYLRVLAENTRAIASYERAGFIIEGLFHDMVYVDNRYHDVQFMAVIADH